MNLIIKAAERMAIGESIAEGEQSNRRWQRPAGLKISTSSIKRCSHQHYVHELWRLCKAWSGWTRLPSIYHAILSSRSRPVTSTVNSVLFSRFLPTPVPSLFIANDDEEEWVSQPKPKPRSSLDGDSGVELYSLSTAEFRRVLRIGQSRNKGEKVEEPLELTIQFLRKHPTLAELLVLEEKRVCMKQLGNLTKVGRTRFPT